MINDTFVRETFNASNVLLRKKKDTGITLKSIGRMSSFFHLSESIVAAAIASRCVIRKAFQTFASWSCRINACAAAHSTLKPLLVGRRSVLQLSNYDVH